MQRCLLLSILLGMVFALIGSSAQPPRNNSRQHNWWCVAYLRALLSMSWPDLPSLTNRRVLRLIFSGHPCHHQKLMQVDQPPAESREESPWDSPSSTPGMRWAIGVALLISFDERASLMSCNSSRRVGRIICGRRKLWTCRAVSDIAKDCSISQSHPKVHFWLPWVGHESPCSYKPEFTKMYWRCG